MGWVADAGLGVRILACGAQAGAAVLVLLMLGVTNLTAMAVLVAATAALHGPLSAMIDASLSHRMVQRPSLNYARIRLWGSIAFIIGNLAGGLTADHLQSDWIAIAIAGGLAAGALVSLSLPQDERSIRSHASGLVAAGTARWGLIAMLIGGVALIQASHAAIYTISALAWKAQGLSQTMTGILWMLGVLTEVVLFLRIGSMVSGVRRAMLFIALGGALATGRWLIMATEPGLGLTMLCQLVHGLTFGATHLGIIAALATLSPPAYRSRIQGSSAAMQALATSGAIYGSGLLYQSGGSPAAFRLMAMLAGAGLVFVLLLYLRERLTAAES